jgi:peptidoglycan/LPS O-acetylase OafA/YrhL
MLMKTATTLPGATSRGMVHNEFIAQMRGVAVLVVVVMHYAGCFPIGYRHIDFVGHGYYGVVMFFAISGFLITTNVLKRYGSMAAVNLGDFYIMRAARILPCLVLAVATLWAISQGTTVGGFALIPGVTVEEAIGYLVTLRFNQFYVLAASVSLAWGVLWSISIEEAFYLVYPITSVILRFERLLIALLCVVIVAGPYFRSGGLLFGYAGPAVSWRTNLPAYLGCFDQLDMGALAAIAAHRIGGKVSREAGLVIGWFGGIAALATYIFLSPREHPCLGPSLVAAGTALMLFASQTGDPRPQSGPTWLGSIGSLSYEIYLFHATFMLLLLQVLPAWDGWEAYIEFGFVMGVVYVACAVLARRFSIPINLSIRSRLSGAHNRPSIGL